MAWSSRLLTLSSLFVALGCVYHDHHDDDDYYYGDDSVCGNLEHGVIDAGALLEAEPGDGVGVYVEYLSEGRWHVFTTCDTDRSGYDCEFDIVIAPLHGAPLYGVELEDLEADDTVHVDAHDRLNFVAYTAFDTDGVYFDTDPGEGIRLDVLLDRECGNRYVYWVGDGAIHGGAPSNPFELEPVEP